MAADASSLLGLPSQLFVSGPVTLGQWRGIRSRDVENVNHDQPTRYETNRSNTNQQRPIEKHSHALDIFRISLSDEEGSHSTSQGTLRVDDCDIQSSLQQRPIIASSRKPIRVIKCKPRGKRSGRHTTGSTVTTPTRRHLKKKNRRKLRASRQLTLTKLADSRDLSIEYSDSLLAIDVSSDPIEDDPSTLGPNDLPATDFVHKSVEHRSKAQRDGDDHLVFAQPPNHSVRPSYPFLACAGDGFDDLELRGPLPRRTRPTIRASKSVFGSLALTSSLPELDRSSFKHKRVRFEQSHAHLHETVPDAARQSEPEQSTSCITDTFHAAQPVDRSASVKDTVAMQLMSLTAPQREWKDSDDESEVVSNAEIDFEGQALDDHDNASQTSQAQGICTTRERSLPSDRDKMLLDDIECSDSINSTSLNVDSADERPDPRPGQLPQVPYVRQWNEAGEDIEEVDASAESTSCTATFVKSETVLSAAKWLKLTRNVESIHFKQNLSTTRLGKPSFEAIPEPSPIDVDERPSYFDEAKRRLHPIAPRRLPSVFEPPPNEDMHHIQRTKSVNLYSSLNIIAHGTGFRSSVTGAQPALRQESTHCDLKSLVRRTSQHFGTTPKHGYRQPSLPFKPPFLDNVVIDSATS